MASRRRSAPRVASAVPPGSVVASAASSSSRATAKSRFTRALRDIEITITLGGLFGFPDFGRSRRNPEQRTALDAPTVPRKRPPRRAPPRRSPRTPQTRPRSRQPFPRKPIPDPIFKRFPVNVRFGLPGLLGTVVILTGKAILEDLKDAKNARRDAEKKADDRSQRRRANRGREPRVVTVPSRGAPRPLPRPLDVPTRPDIPPATRPGAPPLPLPDVLPSPTTVPFPAGRPAPAPVSRPSLPTPNPVGIPTPTLPNVRPFFLPLSPPLSSPRSVGQPAPNPINLPVPNAPNLTPFQPPGLRLPPVPTFAPNPLRVPRPDQARDRCENVKRRRRRRGECAEGIYKERAGDTQFKPFRIRDCATGRIIADPKGTKAQQAAWIKRGARNKVRKGLRIIKPLIVR